jgi:hypothetical protein
MTPTATREDAATGGCSPEKERQGGNQVGDLRSSERISALVLAALLSVTMLSVTSSKVSERWTRG